MLDRRQFIKRAGAISVAVSMPLSSAFSSAVYKKEQEIADVCLNMIVPNQQRPTPFSPDIVLEEIKQTYGYYWQWLGISGLKSLCFLNGYPKEPISFEDGCKCFYSINTDNEDLDGIYGCYHEVAMRHCTPVFKEIGAGGGIKKGETTLFASSPTSVDCENEFICDRYIFNIPRSDLSHNVIAGIIKDRLPKEKIEVIIHGV